MWRFGVLLALVIGVTLTLVALVPADAPPVLGLAPTCGGSLVRDAAGETGPCWLATSGQAVVLVGVSGTGVVFIGMWGFGLLFGLGQATTGLVGIGQLAFGAFLVVAQVGVGLSSLGQLVLGWYATGQMSIGKDGKSFLRTLSADLGRALSFRGPLRD
jgi:hypothetical protein